MHTAVARVSSILRARRASAERERERASAMSSYGDLSQHHGDDSEREHLQAGCSTSLQEYSFDEPHAPVHHAHARPRSRAHSPDPETGNHHGHDVKKNGPSAPGKPFKIPSPGVRIRTPLAYGPIIELRGREVMFAIACFFFLAVCVGLVVVLASKQLKLESEKRKLSKMTDHANELEVKVSGAGLCLTKECLRTSASILDVMDASATPCHDFWQYACGGWLAQNEIPRDESTWNMDSDIKKGIQENLRTFLETPVVRDSPESAERKVKAFYRKCIGVEKIDHVDPDPLIPIVNTFGGWAVEEGWNIAERNGKWNFQNALRDMHFAYWTEVLFMVYVGPDDKSSDTNVLQFDQGGLGLPSTELYFVNESDPLVKAYKKFMMDAAKIFDTPDGNAKHFVEETFAFEKKLAMLHVPREVMMAEGSYNNLTLKELQQLAPRIHWLKFLRHNFTGVSWSTPILVTSKEYMANMSKLVSDTDWTILNYYMVWRLIQTHAKYLSKPFRDALHNYQVVAEGLTRPKDRWEFCLSAANDWFPMATGAMYVQNLFPKESQDEVQEMITHIKEQLAFAINQSDWMDENTRYEAYAKLNSMGENLGSPDFIRDWSKVDVIYKRFGVDETDSFFDTILHGIQSRVWSAIDSLNNTISPEMKGWDIIPHELNAYYSPMENIIIFPAGILQPPYYTRNVPKYLNYARIGASISHEITHGFDMEGSTFDKDGNMRFWWSMDAMNKYANKTKCYRNYYSKYKVDGLQINGEQTMNENIADIEGLKLSYKAYKHVVRNSKEAEMPGLSMTSDQLFFLGFAQVWCGKRTAESMSDRVKNKRHAPEEIRVDGTLSQIPEFAEAFKCPSGSFMRASAKDRCTLW